MKKILSHFVRGIVLLAPLAVTILVLVWLGEWVYDALDHTPFRGAALFIFIMILVAGITVFGYLASNFILKPLGTLVEGLIAKLPLISFIYSSMKDVITAFVGDKKKFDVPVLVTVSHNSTLRKPGFITQESLESLGLDDDVAVYLPHSYAFSGNVMIINKKFVEIIDVSGSDMMKFIVSGGVAELNAKKRKEEKSPNQLGLF